MKFSVLISLYAKERPEFLRQSLDSIFNQSILPNEVVLVEDGQLTPELYEIVNYYEHSHNEMKIVKLPTNGGLGNALNEGLKFCSNELIARMDTDDVAYSDRFEKQLAIFYKYPKVDVVSAWIEEYDANMVICLSQKKLPQFSYEIFKYGKSRCPINHPVVMFRKSALQFAGGYKPFPLFEDYYLWVRLLMNGAKFYNIPEFLLKFRASSDMFRRRGGFKYALTEIKFQWTIKKMGYISWWKFITNIIIRFSIRIIPNNLRIWFYQHLLR